MDFTANPFYRIKTKIPDETGKGGNKMVIIWKKLGDHMVSIPDVCSWHLYSAFGDHEESMIGLDVGGQRLEVCDCWEIMQGNIRVDTYRILDYYAAVVREVYEIVKNGCPEYLDIDQIKSDVLPPFWEDWKSKGLIDHDLR